MHRKQVEESEKAINGLESYRSHNPLLKRVLELKMARFRSLGIGVIDFLVFRPRDFE